MDNRVQQLSFFDEGIDLSGLLPLVKADMRRILGPDGDESRKGFVEKLNMVAKRCGVKLTNGNAKEFTLEMLNKVLSPSDTSHPASLLFILIFCRAANEYAPLCRIVRSVGFDLMSEEDKRFCDFGKAIKAEKLAKKKTRQIEDSL